MSIYTVYIYILLGTAWNPLHTHYFLFSGVNMTSGCNLKSSESVPAKIASSSIYIKLEQNLKGKQKLLSDLT